MRDGGADGIVFKPAAESNTMRIATKTKKNLYTHTPCINMSNNNNDNHNIYFFVGLKITQPTNKYTETSPSAAGIESTMSYYI